jgi:hypothetical protein
MDTWVFAGKPFLEAPENYFGFVYLITNNVTQEKYIGRKQFFSNTSKKVKGRKNRKHTIKASNWKEYWSSSDEVKESVKKYGKKSFTREIIQLCPTRGDLTYGEVSAQIKRDVLTALLPNGQREYLNRNIMARWYAPKLKPF